MNQLTNCSYASRMYWTIRRCQLLISQHCRKSINFRREISIISRCNTSLSQRAFSSRCPCTSFLEPRPIFRHRIAPNLAACIPWRSAGPRSDLVHRKWRCPHVHLPASIWVRLPWQVVLDPVRARRVSSSCPSWSAKVFAARRESSPRPFVVLLWERERRSILGKNCDNSRFAW